MVGTPAYDAGILAGDLIVKIDGKPTEGMRLNEAVDLIQGEKGEKITLTVLHDGTKEPVDVPLVRDEIWKTVRLVRSSGIATLVVDKSVAEVTAAVDRVMILVKGEVVFEGTAAGLQGQPEVMHRHLGV